MVKKIEDAERKVALGLLDKLEVEYSEKLNGSRAKAKLKRHLSEEKLPEEIDLDDAEIKLLSDLDLDDAEIKLLSDLGFDVEIEDEEDTEEDEIEEPVKPAKKKKPAKKEEKDTEEDDDDWDDEIEDEIEEPVKPVKNKTKKKKPVKEEEEEEQDIEDEEEEQDIEDEELPEEIEEEEPVKPAKKNIEKQEPDYTSIICEILKSKNKHTMKKLAQKAYNIYVENGGKGYLKGALKHCHDDCAILEEWGAITIDGERIQVS